MNLKVDKVSMDLFHIIIIVFPCSYENGYRTIIMVNKVSVVGECLPPVTKDQFYLLFSTCLQGIVAQNFGKSVNLFGILLSKECLFV